MQRDGKKLGQDYVIANCNTLQDMNYYLVWYLSQTDGQTDRQTDGKWRIWAHRAIPTGGLKYTGHQLDAPILHELAHWFWFKVAKLAEH